MLLDDEATQLDVAEDEVEAAPPPSSVVAPATRHSPLWQTRDSAEPPLEVPAVTGDGLAALGVGRGAGAVVVATPPGSVRLFFRFTCAT